MLGEKQRATVSPAAPRCGNDCNFNHTTGHKSQSSENLREQLGTVLLALQHRLILSSRKMAGNCLELCCGNTLI